MELSPPAATSAEQTGLNAASPPQSSATASRGQTPNHFHRSKQSTKCRSSHGAMSNGNRGNGIKRSKAAHNSNGSTANGDAANGDIASKTAKDLILTAAASLILKQTNNNGHGAGAAPNVQNQLTTLIAQTLQNMVCERSHGQQHHSCSCSGAAANNGVSSFEQLLAATSSPPMTMTVPPVNKIVYLFEQFVGRKN